MEIQPLVSVIIPNYNYAHFLSQAIDSALNQTYSRVEVIVVDDGSTDDSQEVIHNYEDRITSVIKCNGGQASAFNAGFAVCKGEIICLLDADDLFLPERISEVVRLFQISADINWVFTESAPIKTERLYNENLGLVYKDILNRVPKALPRIVDFREKLKEGDFGNFAPSTSNLCFSRRFAEKIFPLPEIKGISGMAITDLYMKVLAMGLEIGYVTVQDLGIFRMHNNLYSGLDGDKKRGLYGEINTTTGYWIDINFPEFQKISIKLISRGFANYLKSNYLKGKSSDADCKKMIASYLSKVNFLLKFQVLSMISYYFLKILFQKM